MGNGDSRANKALLGYLSGHSAEVRNLSGLSQSALSTLSEAEAEAQHMLRRWRNIIAPFEWQFVTVRRQANAAQGDLLAVSRMARRNGGLRWYGGLSDGLQAECDNASGPQ